jgi:hypothetical protein
MSSSWWDKKLGNQTPQQPTPPVSQPQYVQPQYTQPASTPPVQQTMPMSERCPGCGSGNYGGATPESRKRCYDCGYPIQQSGSGVVGVSMPQSQGPVQPSKQVSTANNFNPQGIIGKI